MPRSALITSAPARWRLSAIAASVLGGLAGPAAAQEPVPAERASGWLQRQAPERYDSGVAWNVQAEQPAQQALRQELVGRLRQLPLSKAPQAADLVRWLESLPVTGRAAMSSADPRWLEVNLREDPVLDGGPSTLQVPERPKTVTVVLDDGQRCRVPVRTGAMAYDYVRACVTDATQRDRVWIAQPDGRTRRHGTGTWNGETQEPVAAGSWIWAPLRSGGVSDATSDLLIRFLATQGIAADTQGYSVPFPADALPDVPSERQRSLPLTASDWGEIGLLQTPTARMAPTGEARLHVSKTQPYTRGTVMLQPLDWVEFGFRYVDIANVRYEASTTGQSTKDKSLDLKVRLWSESRYLPELAAGVRDLGGTGLFSGEYVVASKRTGNFDWSLGLGWGYLGARGNLKNPLSLASDRFTNRPRPNSTSGGTVNGNAYFRGPTSLFGGVQWHTPYDPLIVKLEYDGNNYQREPFGARFEQRVPLNVGVVYRYSPGIDLSAGVERGNKVMFGITFHGGLDRMQSPKVLDTPMPAVQRAYPTAAPSWGTAAAEIRRDSEWSVTELQREDGALHVRVSNAGGLYRSGHFDRLIAVLHRDAPAEVSRFVIEFTEYGLQLGSKTVERADWVRLQTEGLSPAQQQALGGGVATAPLSQPVPAPAASRAAPEWRSSDGRLSGNVRPSLWQSLGGPDSFVLYQVGVQGEAQYRLTRSTWVSGAANLRLIDNYDKFQYTAPSNLPRVRTFMREYVTTSRLTVSNLQLTHAEQWGDSHFGSVYGGMLESMFGGVGAEYLYRPLRSRWALGVDVNRVRQRSFDQHFSFRDYKVTTGHATLYWDTGWNGVHAKVSVGQYLAGDRGATLDLSRRFANGVTIGAYATKTNVSSAQFGEGSFDKGIYLTFPFDAILPRSSSTTGTILWTPLTRDGGARLGRSQDLFSITSARERDAFSNAAPSDGRLRTGDDIFAPPQR